MHHASDLEGTVRLITVESVRNVAILEEHTGLAWSDVQILIEDDTGAFKLCEPVDTARIADECTITTLTPAKHKGRRKHHQTHFHKIDPAN